jgi:hypothetical protein
MRYPRTTKRRPGRFPEGSSQDARQALYEQSGADGADGHDPLEAVERRLDDARESLLAVTEAQLQARTEGLEAQLAERAEEAERGFRDAATKAMAAAESTYGDLEQRLVESAARIAGKVSRDAYGRIETARAQVEEALDKLSRRSARQEHKLARQERDRRMEAWEQRLEERANELGARLDERMADLAHVVTEGKKRIQAAGKRTAADAQRRLNSAFAAELKSLQETLTATVREDVSKDLERRAGELEEGVRAAAAEAYDEARERFNELAESVSVGILAAGLAQEREAKIRESTREAEQRLHELREQISAADALLEERLH